MITPSINLVVLRVRDLETAEKFYSALGLSFAREKHGHGPEHLSADLNGVIFELYPSSGTDSTATRVGFQMLNLTQILEHIEEAGGSVLKAPSESEWGVRAVVRDPDGHKVELMECPEVQRFAT